MRPIIFTTKLILLFLCTHSCDYINPEEEIPAYIHIDNIAVNEENSELTDAWVYVNDNLIGAYDLPAHVPVLETGEKKVTIKGGIKVNGIAVTRGPYPFYKPWELDTVLEPATTVNLNPVIEHKGNLTLKWEETFENVGITLEPKDSTGISITRIDTLANAPSGKVGAIELLADSSFMLQTTNYLSLPYDRDVYLEISFKTNYFFELAWLAKNSIDGSITQNSIYQFNPTDGEWKHVYIYLSKYIRDFNTQYTKFRFLLGSNNGLDQTNYYYFDNIRLIHY